jgi:hypothetical protein
MFYTKMTLPLALIVIASNVNAQFTTLIKFSVSVGSDKIVVSDSEIQLEDSTAMQITALKFYISRIQFLKNKKVVFEEKNSFNLGKLCTAHLIDVADATTQKISIAHSASIQADELLFYLGIDSLTNVSGALGGDLDPTKGMYWTWQSGYINFKLEGKSKRCKTRNNEFQFHLGGYQQPFYCLQTLTFPIKNTNEINIILDTEKIINQLNLTKQNHIMSPNKEALVLSKVVANAFSILQK